MSIPPFVNTPAPAQRAEPDPALPGLRYADGRTTVTVDTPAGREVFTLDGDYTKDNCVAAAEPRGAAPKDHPVCFAEGTLILTTAGEIPVERLQAGDHAVLLDGGAAPIVFIGVSHLDLTQHPRPQSLQPVRIQAGALEDDIPSRDLLLSPDHALYLNGALVPVRHLVDGLRILQDRTVKSIRYFHVELAAHGILIAEGVPAESFLKTGQRGIFDNAAAAPVPPRQPAANRDDQTCAPVITAGAELGAIRSRLYARALMRGFSVRERPLATLKIGKELHAPLLGPDHLIVFRIPPGTTRATLLSPVFTPAEFDPTSADRRSLGLAIAEIALDGRFANIHDIFNKADLHGRGIKESAHWTRGAARLTLPANTEEITLRITAWPKFWHTA